MVLERSASTSCFSVASIEFVAGLTSLACTGMPIVYGTLKSQTFESGERFSQERVLLLRIALNRGYRNQSQETRLS